MDPVSPQCFQCTHFDLALMNCVAFSRIPEEIITNQFDHKKPYPGDHGIQFEQIIT